MTNRIMAALKGRPTDNPTRVGRPFRAAGIK